MSVDPDVRARVPAGASGRGARARELVDRLLGRLSTGNAWPLAAGLATFVVAVTLLAWGTHARAMLRLELAFSQNACCSMQVWVNNPTVDDITVLPIQSGTRTTYTISLWKARIDRLRLPLGEVPGSSVVVRRIWVSRGPHTITQVDASRLAGVTTSDATMRPAPGGGLIVTATGRHPFLDLPVSLYAHERPIRLFFAKIGTQPLESIVALLVAGALLSVPFALRSRRQALAVVTLGLTLLAVRGLPSILWRIPFTDDVSEAVSYSSFAGIPKSRERLLFELSAVAGLVMPALVVGITRLRGKRAGARKASSSHGPPERPLRTRRAAILVGLPIAIVALAAVPDLRALGAGTRTTEYIPSWDSNNLTFWRYLIQKAHLEPMRDFFWPYGLQWIFNLRIPWGDLLSYAGYLTFWVYLFIGLYFVLARFFAGNALLLRYVPLVAFWISVMLAGHVSFTTRYVAPLGVLLLYAGIDAHDKLVALKRVLFAFALLELTLFELAQMAYALVPIVFLLAVELIVQVRKTRPTILEWLAKTGLTVGAPIAIAVGVLAATGELSGNVDYYRHLGAATEGYAWPTQVTGWVTNPTNLASFVFWAVPITIALGAYGLFAHSERIRLAHAIVAAFGLLGFMVMQKQIVRPPVETQLWPAVVFGLVFWAAIETSLDTMRRNVAIAVVGASIAALILVSGGYRKGWDTVTTGPERLASSIGALAYDSDEFDADARTAFAPARFARFVQYRPVVRELQRDPAVQAGGQVWILGDDSPITMMLGQSWPYYFNDLYDTSPIEFQKKVISRLEATPPERVVWNHSPDALVFDTVPQPVRVPLLFEWAIRRFGPHTRVGDFEILGPLDPGEHVDLTWWRRRLGRSVDLGHIPEVAHLPGRSCSGSPGCGTYVIAQFPEGAPKPAEVSIGTSVRGLRFEVEFETSSASRYVIPLDRLWFWSADQSGPHSVVTRHVGTATVTVLRRERDSGVLY